MTRIRILCMILILFLSFSRAGAQNNFSSEEELKKQAEKLFEEKEYAQAFSLYSQLLSLYQNDPNYSYRFGVCMLFSTADKENALPYLEKAAKDPQTEPLVFYFLGRAYHLNYRFAEAITAYTTFKEKAPGKIVSRYDVDHQISHCNNGKKLLKNIRDLVVIEKKELSRIDFFSSYNLESSNAKLIVKPDEFKTSYDVKMKDKSVMYFEQGKDELYFSSYGSNGDNGKDIYMKKRLPTGDWSKPTPLGYPINTEFDEDFPFLHPNGNILYFCSKGHNSMGGYDVFKSVRNEVTGTWTKPINMDFSINTPDDDFMFVSDAEDKTGYFASNRNSPDGMVTVYKIQIERIPVDIAIIKGKITSEDGMPLKAKITVQNLETKEVVGVYNSKEKNGEYLMNLPNGGKFFFIVEAKGYKTVQELVIVPIQYEIKPLGQEMMLKRLDGEDKLVINNKFADQVTDDDYAAVMEILKQRAKLDVNADDKKQTIPPTLVDSDNIVKNDSPRVKKDPPPDITNEDIVKEAYTDAKETQKDATQDKKDADQYLYLANRKNDETIEKQKEYDQMKLNLDNITDPTLKQQEMDKLDKLKSEIELLTQQTLIAYNLAKIKESDAKQKQIMADFELKYAKDLERAIKTNSNTDAILELNKQKDILEEEMKKRQDTKEDYVGVIKKMSDDKTKLIFQQDAKIKDLKDEIADMMKESQRMKDDADKQKDPELKKSQLQQIEENEDEINEKKKQLELVEYKSEKLKREVDSLNRMVDLTNTMITQVNTSPQTDVQVTQEDKDKLNKSVNDYQNNLKNEPIVKNDAPRQDDPIVKKDPGQPTDELPKNTKEIVARVTDVNEKNGDKLKETENIPDPKLKETKKIEVLRQWNESLLVHQKDLQSQVDTTTDLNTKVQLTKELNKVKEKVKENDKLVKKSQTELQQLDGVVVKNDPPKQDDPIMRNDPPKQDDPIVKNDPPKQDDPLLRTNLSPEQKLQEELKDTKEIISEKDRETKRSELYAKLVVELKRQSDSLNKILEKTKDKDEKQRLKDQLTKLDERTGDYESLSLDSKARVEELNSQPNPLPPVTFTTLQTQQDHEKQLELKKESEKLREKSDSLYALANLEKDPEKKKELQDRGDQYKKDSEEKQKESNVVQVKANHDQYMKNDIDLNALIVNSGNSDDPKVITATLLHDESKQLYDKAQQERKKGNEEDALKFEEQSLQKQQESIRLYKSLTVIVKNDPPKQDDPIIKNDPPKQDDPIVKNDPPKQDDPIVKNDPPKQQDPEVINSQEYKDYVALKDQQNNIKNNAKMDYMRSDELDLLSRKQSEESQRLIEQTSTITDPVKQQELLKQSEELDALSLKNKKVADSLKLSGLEKDKLADKKEKEAEIFLTTLDDSTSRRIKENTPVYKQDEPIVKNDPPKQDDPIVKNDPPKQDEPIVKKDQPEINPLQTKIIDRIQTVTVPVYSPSKPIPLNEKLPEGLVFKVQVGAFRNPIDPEIFKGITPLSAETTNAGFTRYTAGLFTTFANADNAKKQIVNLGFRDAFVVAFLNGKRIDINTAIAMMNGKQVEPPKQDEPIVKNDPPKQDDPIIKNDPPGQDEPVPPPVIVKNNDVESTDIKSIDGLIYTVQVGVFSKKVTSRQLFDIKPLNSEELPNGLIRYSSGQYKTLADAVKGKDRIIQLGVKDAFVTAYFKGRRVTLDEAKTILGQQNPDPIVKNDPPKQDDPIVKNDPPKQDDPIIKNDPPKQDDPIIKNDLPKQDDPIVKNDPPKNDPKNGFPTVIQTNSGDEYEVVPNNALSDTGIVFTIMVGEFVGEVPLQVANNLLKVGRQGIKTYTGEDGKKTYTVGRFADAGSAEKAKRNISGQGFTNAEIIAYKNGVRMSYEEAKQELEGR